METLQAYAIKAMKKYPRTVAEADMRYFLDTARGVEFGFKRMIDGLHRYLEAYKVSNGDTVGNTDYLLKEELESLTKSLLWLLNHQGRFDGGTIDGYLRDLGTEHGLELE